MVPSGEITRGRVARVFRFLEAFNQVKNPVPRVVTEQWALWLDDVSTTAGVTAAVIHEPPLEEEDTSDSEPLVLRVRRPKLVECPRLPPELEGWLEDGWRDPERTPRVIASGPGSDRLTRGAFDSRAERVDAFKHWSAARASWAIAEVPNRKADKLFQRLYELHGELNQAAPRQLGG